MIRINQIALPPEHNIAQLSYEAAKALRISNSKVRKLQIVRRSVDARKKPDVKIVYTVDVAVEAMKVKSSSNPAVNGRSLRRLAIINHQGHLPSRKKARLLWDLARQVCLPPFCWQWLA